MVAGGNCFPNCRRSRAREIARSGANERARRGDSIPYLTYRGDASWWSNFVEEEAAAGLFMVAAPLFMVVVQWWLCLWRRPAEHLDGAGGGGGAGQGQDVQGGDSIWWPADSAGGSSVHAQQGPAAAGALGRGRTGGRRRRSGGG
jgi:hypothetical protein